MPKRVVSAGDRKLIIAMGGVLIAVFAMVFSFVGANHSPRPHDLPIGIVGPASVAEVSRAQLDRVDSAGFNVRDYDSLAAAKTAILHRSVYGAYQPDPSPVLVTANAASPAVASLLQRVFGPLAHASGRPLVTEDVAPLPPSDSAGATISSALLGLIIAALAGSSIIYTFTRDRPEYVRIAAIAVIALVAGVITALVTTVILGAFPDGHFFAVWGVASLFVLAMGLPIAASQVLFGAAGLGIAYLLFLVIGNPASGGSTAPELLPPFWRGLSQALPDGAAVTSMRDVVYFNGYGSTDALIVLSVYAVVGGAVAVVAASGRARTRSQRQSMANPGATPDGTRLVAPAHAIHTP